jgi:hypothetical protein
VNAWDAVSVLVLAGVVLVLALIMAIASVKVPARPFGSANPNGSMNNTPGERAEDLLRDVLDEREYQQLRQRGYLDIPSPSNPQRIYRIPRFPGRISVYEGGKAERELCIQSAEPIPSADIVAMHKLMIEGDEKEYLAQANWFPSYASRGWNLPTLP